jgi:hypothetical protein
MTSQLQTELPRETTRLDEAAVAYAARGWRVFPLHDVIGGRCSCGSDCGADAGKHPRTRHGWQDGSLDPVRVLNWWIRWPNANIGIVTGEASGIVALDVDLDKGGYQAFLRLLDELGRPTLLSLVQGTGGGGFHVIYRHPGHRVGNSAKALRDRFGPGLDVRGDGGYIVAAPSLHRSGRRYAWQTDLDAPLTRWPADLNQLLVATVEREEVGGQLEVLDDHRRARTDLDYYWRMVFRRRLNELRAVTSNRNDALNAASFRMGQLVAIGADRAAIEGYLIEAGRILSGLGDHPMPEREILKTVRSGLEAGLAHPDRWFVGQAASS